MRRFDRYRVADDDEVQASYFNGVHEDVDLRLHAVEEKAVGWDEQVARFEDVALGKIDDARVAGRVSLANFALNGTHIDSFRGEVRAPRRAGWRESISPTRTHSSSTRKGAPIAARRAWKWASTTRRRGRAS